MKKNNSVVLVVTLSVTLLTMLSTSLFSCTKKASLDEYSQGKEHHKNHGAPKAPPLATPTAVNTDTLQTQSIGATKQPAVTPASDAAVNINKLPATVVGIQTSQLSFHTPGYISAVLVKNGDFVKKGQVIAKLDAASAEQQLNLSKLAFEKTKGDLHYAELSLKRTQTLSQREATTQIALEQSQANYENAQIAVKQAQANLKLAQITFDDNSLIAPFDGYIFNLSSWIGNYVTSTTLIANMTSVNGLQIRIPVPQTVPNTFHVGQEFRFSNSSQNIEGTLKVTGIVPFVDDNTKTYLIYAIPTEIKGNLMAGELVVVNLQ
jgi:membrane fusion protein (multidrug efflux system)